MVSKRLRRSALFLAGILLVTGVVMNGSVDAQKPRKKTSKVTPRVTPTPAEPAVVSRADDFPIEILQGNPLPQQTIEQPLSGQTSDATIEELRERLARLEAGKKADPDERRRRLATNLDILTKSEQRSDTLRKQLFEMIEKESTIKSRIDQIDNEARPEAIERSASMTGSLRPEELRAQRKRSLDLEKQNLQLLLTEVQKNKTALEANITRADSLSERIRVRLEKDIDDALTADEETIDKPEN